MSSLNLLVMEPPEQLSVLLERAGLACQVRSVPWNKAWDELKNITLYRTGPDVSEVGTTWVNGLVETGAVRPFTDQEVEAMGGQSVFLPTSWQTSYLPSWGGKVWAIPWLAGVRVLFYWRDMLEEAGIDEKMAFQTVERIEETMAQLQASGVEAPWGIWETEQSISIHNIASWVWGTGGDFVKDDGRRVLEILFDQPEACEGLIAYFRLQRYTSPSTQSMTSPSASRVLPLFSKRQAAVMMGIAGWIPQIYEQSGLPDAACRLGVASPPGPAFVGGSNLVVWRHTPRQEDAVELVRFLVSKQAQLDYARHAYLMPVRLDALSEPPYATDPNYQAVFDVWKSGRSFPAIPGWGLVEERLAESFTWLHDFILADPDQDLEDLINLYMESVARRLVVPLGLRK